MENKQKITDNMNEDFNDEDGESSNDERNGNMNKFTNGSNHNSLSHNSEMRNGRSHSDDIDQDSRNDKKDDNETQVNTIRWIFQCIYFHTISYRIK